MRRLFGILTDDRLVAYSDFINKRCVLKIHYKVHQKMHCKLHYKLHWNCTVNTKQEKPSLLRRAFYGL